MAAEETNAHPQPSADPAAAPKKKSKKIALIVAIIVVVALACGGIAWYLIDQHNKAVWEQEHREYPVTIEIVAEGYDPISSTPVPVHVQGTDFEGGTVDFETLVNPALSTSVGSATTAPADAVASNDTSGESDGSSESDDGISLMRGTYTVTVTASPFLADGTMYDVSSTTATFEVTGTDGSQANANQDQGSEGAEGQTKVSLSMSRLGADAMSEELIQTASDKLVSLGFDEGKLQGFTSAANEKIQQYQAELEAAAKAAEEAALAARLHVSTTWYEFDIPRDWDGLVEYRTEGTTTTVYPVGYPNYGLFSVNAVDPQLEVMGGRYRNGHDSAAGRLPMQCRTVEKQLAVDRLDEHSGSRLSRRRSRWPARRPVRTACRPVHRLVG